VLEHEVVPVIGEDLAQGQLAYADPWFTEAEAQALLRLNDIRRGFCQRLSGGIKLAQHCGIVRLPNCVVEVLPKIGMTDSRTPNELDRSRGALLTMLHSARDIRISKIGSVPQQGVRAPLLDIFVQTFLHCALEQARRGLLSRYVQHADDLPVIKGRFQAQGHVRRNIARPHLLHCEYDEFTADNPYNRAIRKTLDVCRTWASQAITQRLWHETHARFSNVSLVPMSSAEVAALPRDRTTHHYLPVLVWCQWLLGMCSPALSAGASKAPGLLFDMNKLFEAHVSGLEDADASDGYIVHRQGPVEALAKREGGDAFPLRPDITVWHAAADGSTEGIARILDAKWKRLDPHATQWGVDQSDVYQMVAYALHYDCRLLELVYPEFGPASVSAAAEPMFKINAPGLGPAALEVRVRTVPLWRKAVQ